MADEHKILVVDDEPANLRLLQRVLGDDYQTLSASSGAEALKILQAEDVSLIITDQRMPHMTGVELLEKSLGICPHAIKILLTGYTDVEALIDAINQGHIYKYIPKPWDADDLRLTVKRALEAYELSRRNDILVKDLQKAISQLEEISMGVIRALANALDAKCDYTSGHSLRVGRYAALIGKALGLSKEKQKELEVAGILHDIGKIGVPEAILWKPDKLTAEEQKIMSQHPVRSAQIIGNLPALQGIKDLVLHHHEYLDGSGYPDQLKGDDIPLGARIVLVADAYDAMTSDRPYRKAIGHEKAGVELRKHAGKQFDEKVVAALLAVVGEKGEKINHSVPESVLDWKIETIDPERSAKHSRVEAQHQVDSDLDRWHEKVPQGAREKNSAE